MPTPLERIPLGNGLELWRVPIGLPKEQEVNARVMPPGAFKQLSENIRREQRLESLPLCALVEDNLEVISGHHRLRASKMAGLKEIWVLVDVTGLPRDKIRSKQLSHNSLQGVDDADLVKKIFSAIEDAEQRIAAFIEASSSIPKVELKLNSLDLEVQFDTKTATLVFLQPQLNALKEALELLKAAQVDEVLLATRDEYETLISAVSLVGTKYQVSAVPTIIAKMAEIVIAHCNQLQTPE